MGNFKTEHLSLGDVLFSKTQQQVMRLLFGQPDRSFYSKEIVDLAGVGTGTVHRELEKLLAVGLVTTRRIGNQKHFQANRQSPIFAELQGIVRKTFGLADLLRKSLAELEDKVAVAFIYGSVAKGSDSATSDIDVLIVSDHLTYPDVLTKISELEHTLGRPVNPAIYSVEEFTEKIAADDSFISRIIAQPKIFLIGSDHDIPTIRQPGRHRPD